MKLVKFNAKTQFRCIPDEQYDVKKTKLDELAVTDTTQYLTRLNYERNTFPRLDVNIGQEVEVPNWYYEAHKDNVVNMSVHIKTRHLKGNKESIIPFDVEDALQQGQIKSADTMQKVKLFDLIRDLDTTKKAKAHAEA